MKFVCNSMLGRLAKYLRMLGYNTLYFRDIRDDKLLSFTSQGYIILTRDKALGNRKNVIILKSTNVIDQLRELKEILGISFDRRDCRCPECNTPLIKVTDKKPLIGKIPSEILNSHDIFYICPNCGKIYWEGSHWYNFVDSVKKILG